MHEATTTKQHTAQTSAQQEENSASKKKKALSTGQGLHVLLVEDNDIVRLSLKCLFERYEAQVTAFENAEAAWAWAPWSTINLVVTDLGLPGASGLEFVSWINQHHRNPPWVVALSAHLDADLKQQCLAVGMQAAYLKPLTGTQIKTLLSHVRRSLHPMDGSALEHA